MFSNIKLALFQLLDSFLGGWVAWGAGESSYKPKLSFNFSWVKVGAGLGNTIKSSNVIGHICLRQDQDLEFIYE